MSAANLRFTVRVQLKGEGAMRRLVSKYTACSVTAAALFAFLIFTAPSARAQGQGQDKAAPMSQVQRLNRAPVNKEILRVQLPRPTVAKLPNGLTLVLQEDHKLPTIAFTMWIRPGQLADPSELPGLASFTAGMVCEGKVKWPRRQKARERVKLG